MEKRAHLKNLLRVTFSCASFLFYLWISTSWSGNGPEKFEITNRGRKDLYCYRFDSGAEPRLCRKVLHAYESCEADAVSASIGGTVFRVPRGVEFNCDGNDERIHCTPRGSFNELYYNLSFLESGEGYGLFNWERFFLIYGENIRIIDSEDCPIYKESLISSCGRDASTHSARPESTPHSR